MEKVDTDNCVVARSLVVLLLDMDMLSKLSRLEIGDRM